MGALTGFHPILSDGLISFTDIIGATGIRVNQFFERVHGVGKELLKEVHISSNDVLLVVTATGATVAAVDLAIAFNELYPENPIIGLASAAQSSQAPPKHRSGKNLYHVIENAKKGIFIDNGMPVGDLSVKF